MTTFADVTMLVRIKNLGSWGDDCTAKQIREQAEKAALGKLKLLIKDKDLEVIGDPDVRAIFSPLKGDGK